MDKETNLKIQIANAAASKFIENRRFSIELLAKDLKLEAKQIFDLFPNRSSILEYFYESRVLSYSEEIRSIKGYDEFTLAEKLNQFFLSLIEQFEEHREFVLLTFRQRAGAASCSSPFTILFIEELKSIYESDNNISTSATMFLNYLYYRSVLLKFNGLIYFWMNDNSVQRENTLALTDKWSACTQEVFYSKIVDKSSDLIKFMICHSPLSSFFTTKTERGQ